MRAHLALVALKLWVRRGVLLHLVTITAIFSALAVILEWRGPLVHLAALLLSVLTLLALREPLRALYTALNVVGGGKECITPFALTSVLMSLLPLYVTAALRPTIYCAILIPASALLMFAVVRKLVVVTVG